jgi:hypothetical protein
VTGHPLEYRCPVCGANPGQRCVWRDPDGAPTFRRPHAERVLRATSR